MVEGEYSYNQLISPMVVGGGYSCNQLISPMVEE
jgi:hypothetical protein